MSPSAHIPTLETVYPPGTHTESHHMKGKDMKSLPHPPESAAIAQPTSDTTTPAAAPTHEPWNFRDNLAYEDKWLGWDGPVWCNRFGRFEDKAQAAEDDGHTAQSPAAHLGKHFPTPSTTDLLRSQWD